LIYSKATDRSFLVFLVCGGLGFNSKSKKSGGSPASRYNGTASADRMSAKSRAALEKHRHRAEEPAREAHSCGVAQVACIGEEPSAEKKQE
jgi:hypothetical protein